MTSRRHDPSRAHDTAQPHDHHHDSIAELLDLDADVLHRYLLDVMDWVHARAPERAVPRILDLGAGTGTGTIALADRFPSANVVAVDMSEGMLDRVRDRALAAGLAKRVSIVQMNLDGSWTGLGSFDIVWASAALHELSSPDRTFSNILRLLTPGGLLAVVEMDGPPRFLEDEIGDGVEVRIHAPIEKANIERIDHPDWSDNLQRAGFTQAEKTALLIDMAIESGGTGGLYAQAYLRRVRDHVAGGLSRSDRTMLDALVADNGPLSLRRRDDLHLRASRTVWAARRP